VHSLIKIELKENIENYLPKDYITTLNNLCYSGIALPINKNYITNFTPVELLRYNEYWSKTKQTFN